MNIKSFVFNPFYENTLVVASKDKNAYIFDPGCYEPFELDELIRYIETENLLVQAMINTHCHIDHVLGNFALKERYQAPLMIPENEREMFDAVSAYSSQWGISNYRHTSADQHLRNGDVLSLDDLSFHLIEVPDIHRVTWYFTIKKIKYSSGEMFFSETVLAERTCPAETINNCLIT